MITWFKTLFKIVRKYDSMIEHLKNVNSLQSKINIDHSNRLNEVHDAVHIAERARQDATQAVNYIKERTEVSADINMRRNCPNTIIVVGRYKNRDYVEVFDVDDMDHMVNDLRRMQKFHHRKVVDGPPQFKAFVDAEMDRY